MGRRRGVRAYRGGARYTIGTFAGTLPVTSGSVDPVPCPAYTFPATGLHKRLGVGRVRRTERASGVDILVNCGSSSPSAQ